jgi:hypothetical protein
VWTESPLNGTTVHRLSFCLLRRHVVGRPDDHPGPRERARRLEGLGDAEVGEHHLAVVVEHDVGGLHVAVHDAALVRVPQGASGFPQHPLDVVGGEGLLLLLQHVLERGAGDVLHHEIVEPAFALDAVDRDDVGVVELGGGLRLLLEALDDVRVLGDVGRQDLDGHLPVQGQVLGEEHRAHAALAEHALELVLALDQALQAVHQAFDLPAGGRVGAASRLIRAAREAELAIVGQRRVALNAVDRGAHGRRGFTNGIGLPGRSVGRLWLDPE